MLYYKFLSILFESNVNRPEIATTMDCRICFEKYNTHNRKPITLMPCCHTFCLSCLINLFKSYDFKFNCPKCREKFYLCKPNRILFELMKPESKYKPQYSRIESINNEIFYSENHDHSFELLQNNDDDKNKKYVCHGNLQFGKCKSSKLDRDTKFYKCTLCYRFILCQKCLEEPKIPEDKWCSSPNHPHPLLKIESNNDDWICAGFILFGKCKSGLDKFGFSHNKTRYFCSDCNDFDLCQECFEASKVEYEHLDKFKIYDPSTFDLEYLFNDQTLNMTLN